MDFQNALNIVTAELTPKTWTYTDTAGTTLTVLPACLREDHGNAEVLIRITRADASGLAEVGITTTDLPALIQALTERTWWADNALAAGALLVAARDGVVVSVSEAHGPGQQVDVSMVLPDAQRMPLASALRRAHDVARGWEDPA